MKAVLLVLSCIVLAHSYVKLGRTFGDDWRSITTTTKPKRTRLITRSRENELHPVDKAMKELIDFIPRINRKVKYSRLLLSHIDTNLLLTRGIQDQGKIGSCGCQCAVKGASSPGQAYPGGKGAGAGGGGGVVAGGGGGGGGGGGAAGGGGGGEGGGGGGGGGGGSGGGGGGNYLLGLPEGPRKRGITRGTTKIKMRPPESKKQTTASKWQKKKPQPPSFSMAYETLLQLLNNKVNSSRAAYFEITRSFSALYNASVETPRLAWMGFPMNRVVKNFAAQLSNHQYNYTDEEHADATAIRLYTFKNRAKLWSARDKELLQQMDDLLLKFPTHMSALMESVWKIKTYPDIKSGQTGEELCREIFNAFLSPFDEMGNSNEQLGKLMDDINDQLKKNGLGRPRGRRQHSIIRSGRKITAKDYEEIEYFIDMVQDMEYKVKYSRLLLSDIDYREYKNVDGCVCNPNCYTAPKRQTTNWTDSSDIEEADVAFPPQPQYEPLVNYYDNVNNGYLPVAYEMFMDAIANLNEDAVKEVIKHSEAYIKKKLWQGDLKWLGNPMTQVIIGTSKVFTHMDMEMLSRKAAEVQQHLQYRYDSYAEITNNILDYADTLITETKGKHLIETMQTFENIENKKINPPELCEDIIDAFEGLFADLEGTYELQMLMWYTNKALTERYPRLNRTKFILGRRNEILKRNLLDISTLN